MSAAYVIEVRGRQAGLVVEVARKRFRFFAAIAEAASLEGAEFRTATDAARAAKRAVAGAPGR